MDYATPADKIRIALGIDPVAPVYTPVASALMNPVTGARGLSVDRFGNLVAGAGGSIRPQRVYEDFAAYRTADTVSVINPSGVAFATTTAMVHHMYTPSGNIFSLGNIGVQTTIPVMVAAGLDIRGVETNAIGTELFTHFVGATGRPFVIGRDPGFFLKASVTVEDISGAAVLIFGFRNAAVNNVTYTGYTDYVVIGVLTTAATAAIKIASELGGSGIAGNPIDTTDTWADGATKIIEVRVNSAGVASFFINGVAPTVTTALGVFTDGIPVIPFIHFIQDTTIAGAITLNQYEVDYLP